MKVRYLAMVSAVWTVLIFACSNGICANRPAASADAPADTSNEAKSATALQQTLLASQQALFDAIKRKDPDYCKKAVADDFVLITTTGEVAGRDEIVEAARSGALQALPRMYNIQSVSLDDDAAVLTYDVVFTDSKPRYQHISSTWAKDGDQWRLKFQQSTPNVFSLGDE